MKLTCPHCGAVAGLDAWANDAQIRQCLRIVAEMPREISTRAVGYLALFRPPSGRGLAWAKALRLLAELADMTAADSLSWKRRPARPVSARIWGAALERVATQPPRDLPLDSHGYLKAVAYALADEADRERAEAARREAERDGSARPQRDNVEEPQPFGGVSREEIRAFREKLKKTK